MARRSLSYLSNHCSEMVCLKNTLDIFPAEKINTSSKSFRDLSNGYAYAEILHCYFPHEINMFTFINGRSLNSRLSNWALIKQFLTKKNLPISMEYIDATIHGREGGAEELLDQTYQLFTNKK